MIYNFDLKTVGLVVGIALVVAHLVAMLHAKHVRGWLLAFPRSKTMGTILLGMVVAWAYWLASTMDLGEFSNYQGALKIGVPVVGVICFLFVNEFLPVRALGILLLLLAEPVLEAAFLRPEISRLLLVTLAYAWVVAGMFWVGMPYLMRDQIAWLLKSNSRWTALCVAGVAYGAAVLISALMFYGQI